MSQTYFVELKEWSARKHALLTAYLTGFARILGGSRNRLVYYIDGFAGPGKYDDGAKGSPLLAAEYAQSLAGKDYGLHCINVEINRDYFENLERNTLPYHSVVTNKFGGFGDHIDAILSQIEESPAIFFLDPFGIRGIEARNIFKAATRSGVTELLLRISPVDIQRLAGFSGLQTVEAIAKCQALTDLFGFSDPSGWETVWRQQGTEGLVRLYMERVGQQMLQAKKRYFVCRYPIRTIEGDNKYFLIFVTSHPKGAVLMNDVIYNLEESYEVDVARYKASKPHQLSMFGTPEPSVQEIFDDKVDKLQEAIWQQFRGATTDRLRIREAMFAEWFGKVKGAHFTCAFRNMQQTGRIIAVHGRLSDDHVVIKFGT